MRHLSEAELFAAYGYTGAAIPEAPREPKAGVATAAPSQVAEGFAVALPPALGLPRRAESPQVAADEPAAMLEVL